MGAPAVTGPTPLRLPPDHALHRVQRVVGGAALVCAVACAIAGVFDPTQLLRAYLTAYVFWAGAALGCLAVLMIHHVTGGAWGTAIRRLLESGAATLPWLALLFLPIALGAGRLYEWAQPEHVAHDPLLQHKALYLNVPFFLGRAAFYFVVWIIMMRALRRWSLAQDAGSDPKPAERLELLSRGGLLLMGLTMSFAAIDWMMSLEPHWFSTIYGVLYMGGSALTAFALVIPVVALLATAPPLAGRIETDQLHDLGKLLLAFVMLWGYFNLSQFLIIWSGNLPEEIPWYLARTQGPWRIIIIGIVVLHFALPFVLLLSRTVKRSPRALAAVALGLLVVRALDVLWMVAPAFPGVPFAAHLLDAATIVALGGLWFWLFVRGLAAHPLLPLHDPSAPDAHHD